jgi:hypothetical protein
MVGKRGSNFERFQTKFIVAGRGCWQWQGSLNAKGYGWFYYPPRNMVHAHIVAWELYKGSRQGLYVLHTCDNPGCVNPGHLYLGTQQDNVRDRDARQRRAPPKGSLNGRATLTEKQVVAIRLDPRAPRFVAKAFNTTSRIVQRIRRKETWRHV